MCAIICNICTNKEWSSKLTEIIGNKFILNNFDVYMDRSRDRFEVEEKPPGAEGKNSMKTFKFILISDCYIIMGENSPTWGRIPHYEGK